VKNCLHCGKRVKTAYYHTDRANDKKWIPILQYCFSCEKFYSYSYPYPRKKKLIKNPVRIRIDNRYQGAYHDGRIGLKPLTKVIMGNVLENLYKQLPVGEIEKLKNTMTDIYCNQKMIKLYSFFRIDKKQKWIPVFWYCPSCKKVVSKINDFNTIKDNKIKTRPNLLKEEKKCR